MKTLEDGSSNTGRIAHELLCFQMDNPFCKRNFGVFRLRSRVYAYAVGDGEGADEGESAKPAQNDFQARLAMFKKKETGPAGTGA